ncbi:hypothetical protein B0H14DRAFT_2176447, partial [Mycena olivaceomarginata]
EGGRSLDTVKFASAPERLEAAAQEKLQPWSTAPSSVWRCPRPNCSKAYKQANGLKYHLKHGSC